MKIPSLLPLELCPAISQREIRPFVAWPAATTPVFFPSTILTPTAHEGGLGAPESGWGELLQSIAGKKQPLARAAGPAVLNERIGALLQDEAIADVMAD